MEDEAFDPMASAGSPLPRVSKVALIGALNTGLDIACFLLLTYVVGLDPSLSNVVSYGAGIACSYVLNRNWAFRDRAATARKSLVLFLGSNLASLALGTAMIVVLTGFVPTWLAKCLSVLVTFGLNYVCYNWLVFTEPRRPLSIAGPTGNKPDRSSY